MVLSVIKSIYCARKKASSDEPENISGVGRQSAALDHIKIEF
jgi:hypothetical protein